MREYDFIAIGGGSGGPVGTSCTAVKVMVSTPRSIMPEAVFILPKFMMKSVSLSDKSVGSVSVSSAYLPLPESSLSER